MTASVGNRVNASCSAIDWMHTTGAARVEAFRAESCGPRTDHTTNTATTELLVRDAVYPTAQLSINEPETTMLD
jgi:hypothetical protein